MRIENLKCFKAEGLHFSRGINILVGPNNAGKSSLLFPILALQQNLRELNHQDVRMGEARFAANVNFQGDTIRFFQREIESVEFSITAGNVQRQARFKGGSIGNIGQISNKEPNNFIYPFLSRRKTGTIQENVSEDAAYSVHTDFQNLTAKIDKLQNPDLPFYQQYRHLCTEVLGFPVTTVPRGGGKQAVLAIDSQQNIPLITMGEGAINIIGLIVHLVVAEEQLFLIEELENDIHPGALKPLLSYIQEKSKSNQFIITTHSNIVLKQLGGTIDSKILSIEWGQQENRTPACHVRPIGESPQERSRLLENLGYEFSDFDLWQGWLFLEESTIEKFVRDYFIPWYVPDLRGRLRTYSAHSLSEIGPKFNNFNNLFVFLHLEPTYKNRVWVLVDGGVDEKKLLDEMISKYTISGWAKENFMQLDKHNFEEYYPERFREMVDAVNISENNNKRREEKKKLFDCVEKWTKENEETACKEFKVSAKEIIERLSAIQDVLVSK